MQTIRKQTKNDPSRAGDGFRVARLLREINAAMNERIASSVAGTGLTLPQIMAVKALAHAGGLTVGQLARELAVGKSTAVGVVDRLEAAGLVTRQRGGDDRREVRVVFAENAGAELARIRRAMDECFASAFQGLDAESLSLLCASLETVLDTLGRGTGAGTRPAGDDDDDGTRGRVAAKKGT